MGKNFFFGKRGIFEGKILVYRSVGRCVRWQNIGFIVGATIGRPRGNEMLNHTICILQNRLQT